MVSGIVSGIKHGLQCKDALSVYMPHETLYNRFICWSPMGVFDRIFAGLADEGPKPERIMIDAMHLRAHRTVPSLIKKRMLPVVSGVTRGGLNSNLHNVCDGDGRPIIMLLPEGQMSDHKGARLMLDALPRALTCLQIQATIMPGFARNSRNEVSSRASRRNEAAKSHTLTTSPSTASATMSTTCSPSSRTGGVSSSATTDRTHLLLRNLHRSSRHLTDLINGPEHRSRVERTCIRVHI
jgi:transposase